MLVAEGLIDRIYECSVVPENWPSVLDDVAALANSDGGLLFSARKALNWTASERVSDIFAAYVEEGWFGKCSRRLCLMNQDTPSFFVEHDFWTDEEIDADPVYRDFFRPRGLGWSAGTGVQVPTGDSIVFSVERAFADGPIGADSVARLNKLRPHLARSALVSARLQHRRAQGAAEALAALQLPAFLLRAGGEVAETSEYCEGLGSHILWTSGGRLRLVDRRADQLLGEALGALAAGADDGVRSFAVRDDIGIPQQVAHVVPIRRAAHDIFGNCYALLLLIPVASDRIPSATLMKSLFDLTPAEARIASGIARGNTPEMLAVDGEVAISTVRSQIRRVFEKTGCSKQSDLSALMARIGSTAPD